MCRLIVRQHHALADGRAFIELANHVGSLDVEIDLARAEDLAATARAIQGQVEAQRRRHAPEKRILAERLFVLGLPLVDLQRVVFESRRPATSLNFSNLIALPSRRWRGLALSSRRCISRRQWRRVMASLSRSSVITDG
jgi:hypothetical protein